MAIDQFAARTPRTGVLPSGQTLELHVHLLGTPRVTANGTTLRLSRSAAQTLAFLAIGPDEGRSRILMAAQLFADCPEPVARRRLSTALWRLRTEFRDCLGRDIVNSVSPHRICLMPNVDVHVDAKEFRERVTPALNRPVESLGVEEAEGLAAAVASYTGSLLETTYDDWVIAERDNLSDLYLAVLDLLVQYYGRLGDSAQVTRYAAKAVALEPLREDLHRHVMLAFDRSGRPDLADRQFETFRLALLRELGADPMPETVALHTRITAGHGAARSGDLAALVADLERARRDVQELAALVERALDAVVRLR
jgi:DNA-binding SARP family transcriptional activator